MKKVTLKEIITALESIQAQHQVTQEKLAGLRKALDLLDPEAAIELQEGKAMLAPWPNVHGKICSSKR